MSGSVSRSVSGSVSVSVSGQVIVSVTGSDPECELECERPGSVSGSVRRAARV